MKRIQFALAHGEGPFVDGMREGVKGVMRKIEYIQHINEENSKETSGDLLALKNELGQMIYKDWPIK